jgi:hypothetical protein
MRLPMFARRLDRHAKSDCFTLVRMHASHEDAQLKWQTRVLASLARLSVIIE